MAGQRFRQALSKAFHENSTRLVTFYHQYILCNKHYVPSTVYRFSQSSNVTTRYSNTEQTGIRSKKTSLL